MSKEAFANELHFLTDGNLSANECERYGMTWGCDENCPALSKGKCEHWKSVDEYLESDHANNKFT